MYIRDILIVDPKNHEANRYEFDNKANLVISNNNSQGKSSLIKSIFYALGFDIKKFPDKWDAFNMIIQMRIKSGNNTYIVTRYKDKFKIDDSDFMSQSNYSLEFQKILDIDLKLTVKHTKSLNSAYSSAIILPFYVDQDDSWSGKPYDRVTNSINMYSGVPSSIFDYLFELSNEPIQELESHKSELNSIKNKLNTQINILKEYKNEEHEKLDKIVNITPLDMNSLKTEIDYYLTILNDFNKETNKFKGHIINNTNKINNIDQEIKELQKLLNLYKGEYKSIESVCTHCNSQLTNEQSLKRLKVNNNIISIQEMIIDLKEDKEKAEKKLNEYQDNQNQIAKKIQQIENELNKSESLLNIHEYIDSAAKEKTITNLENNILEKYSEHEEIKNEITKINREIRKLKETIKTRKENLSSEYTSLVGKMNMRLSKVVIDKLMFNEFKDIGGSGMVTNKKLFAYYLVYFNLIYQYGRYQLPFGMDSFIKNESSIDNKDEMFEIVEDYLLKLDTQSFFSILSENINYLDKPKNYKHIIIQKRLLTKDFYEENKEEIHTILD